MSEKQKPNSSRGQLAGDDSVPVEEAARPDVVGNRPSPVEAEDEVEIYQERRVYFYKWFRLHWGRSGKRVTRQREPGGLGGQFGDVLREEEDPNASFLGSRGVWDQPPHSSL